MSAIFKLVLGQKVVHPGAANRKNTAESHETEDATTDREATTGNTGSSPSVAANGTKVTPGGFSNGSGRPASTGARAASPPTNNGKQSDPIASSPSRGQPVPSFKTGQPSSSSAPAPPTSAPRPSTPTRTLLLRIEGCTVAQDIRDALRDLLRCPDLPYVLDDASLKSLLSLLASYAEDQSITEPTLHLLANATDIDLYPSQFESNRRTVDVTMADKRHARDELLQVLVDAVPLLLESMSTAAPFWARYYAVVLLQRLEEFEPSRVNQALLAARGVGAILDALNETEHDNVLRNQALLLLTSLTLADPELQTLLAFDNAFDSLFDLVQREGGVLDGGAVVRDSLTVVLNLLRSNKATQKFFREMGCAARLAALFETIPAELTACMVADQRRGPTASPTASNWPQPTVATEKMEALLKRAGNPDAMLNVLMSVSILACVLRGYEEAEDEFHATQDALLRCGLLHPLTRLAFCGLAIDDATRIEAVRVLALLLDRSKRAMEEWFTLAPLTTLVRSALPYAVRVWPAPRALLSYVCETTDTTLVNAGVQLFLSALSVPACQERAVGIFLGGLVGSTGSEGGSHSSTSSSPTAAAKAASTVYSSNGNAQTDPQCGSALARILLAPSTSAVEKYYTAQVLRTLIGLPAAAKLSEALVRVAVPVELQQGRLDALVRAQPGWALSSQLAPSFFNYYVSFLLFAISGGAASQQMNTSALGAYVAALLAWTGACPWAAAALVQEVSWGDTLLHQARRDGAAHLRLWSAMLIARGCVVVRAATVAASHKSTPALKESATSAAGGALVQRFLQMVGGGAALDTILFDAQASTPAWQHPVASGLRTQTPTPYDESFVAQVEQLVLEFKRLLSSLAGSSSSSSVPKSLPPLTHLAQPPPYASSTAEATAPSYASSDARQLQPPPALQQAHLGMAGASPRSMAFDAHAERSPSSTSQAAPPQQSSQLLTGTSGPNSVPSEEVQALVDSLQAQLRAAQAERATLMAAAEEWRGRAEESEAQCRTLQEAREKLTTALSKAEAELEHERDAAANAQASAVSADAVENLEENIRLLEEALSSKEEEQQQLVESLNMMEDQLRHATSAAAAANDERAAAVAAAQRQQQQQQQQRPALPSPPPPPLPPQGPPPEALAAMEAERKALQQQLEEAHREAARLQQTLHAMASDYHELLLMVAELNEECASVKANSSMAPTPARQLADWPSASPSVDRTFDGGKHPNEAAAPSNHPFLPPQQGETVPTVSELKEYYAVPASTSTIPVPSPVVEHVPNPAPQFQSSLPVEAATEQWGTDDFPAMQLADVARTASALGYAEATDVLIDSPASQSSPNLPAAGLQNGPPSLSSHTSSHHASGQNALPSNVHSMPPPPPPPPPPSSSYHSSVHTHKHGGLPNPLQTRRSAPHTGSAHGPRYADPSGSFFHGCASAQGRNMSASQPPPPPPPHPPSRPSPQTPAAAPMPAWTSPQSTPGHDSPPAYQSKTPTPPFFHVEGTGAVRLPEASQDPHNDSRGPLGDSWEYDAPHPLPPTFQNALRQQPMADQNWDSAEQHTTFPQHDAPPHTDDGAAPRAEAPPPPLSAAGEKEGEIGDAPPLSSADDFFGSGGGDDEADGTAPYNFVDTNAEVTPQANVLPPLPKEGEKTDVAQGGAVNPFSSRGHLSPHHDHLVVHASDTSTEGRCSLPPALPAAQLLPSPSTTEKREEFVSISETAAPPLRGTAPPPPPPPSSAFKHPASALAGNAHHLNYRGNPEFSQPSRQAIEAALPALPQEREESESIAAASGAPPTSKSNEENRGAAPPSTALYNPFADFQAGDDDDDDDGLADLR